MSPYTIIELDNFKDYLNKDVQVDVTSYEKAYIYPLNNKLIGMNEHFYYFFSEEDGYWHFPVTNDEVETIVYVEEN